MVSALDRLGRFREYLQFLARSSWNHSLSPKLDWSDLVQETLLNAVQKFDQFRGESDAELAGWLRQILANVVAERQRHFKRDKRDAAREQSLEKLWAESSRRLSGLGGPDPTPGEQVEFNERALRVAAAVEALPAAQRDALILHYWQGQTIPQMADLMQRNPPAVAGLVHRALRKLRSELADLK
jgi:RNA polymerase sigma-70 factor (ECF subfamily)